MTSRKLGANLRSAIFDNTLTRPRLISHQQLNDGYGIPTYRMPLERSIKPLPTLPYIVGNTTYDPNVKETPGTGFIRDKLLFSRSVLPTLSATGEPSKTNPTVL